jgi:prefoldin subunit 5
MFDPGRKLMTVNHQVGDLDAQEALIQAQAESLEAEHQMLECDVVALLEISEMVRSRWPGRHSPPDY